MKTMENQKTEVTEPRKITISELSTLVEEGKKRDWLAEYYGLPVSVMAKVLKEAGLKIRKFQKPKYVLVDDTTETTSEAKDAPQVGISEEVFNTTGSEDEDLPNEAPEAITPKSDWL